MKIIKVKCTTFEPMLGLCPDDKEIYRTYITSKAPTIDKEDLEVASLNENPEDTMKSTIFPRTADGIPCLWDYQIRGYFKDTCSALARLGNTDENGKKVPITKSGKLKAFKKIIDGNIFVAPRQIPIIFNGEIGWCERPLRADTPQGSRVALARSEEIPAGATLTFDILLLEDSHEDVVKEWLNYGHLRGFGQWRNSGKGRFKHEILDIQTMPLDLLKIADFTN
jgi:hypothetical protein